MQIIKLLNENEPTWQTQRKDALEYLDKVTKPEQGRTHLTWQEKRRERALRYKSLRKGLTKEEQIEYNDLNYVEIITEGEAIRSKKWNTMQPEKRRIQTRSITRKYQEQLKEVKRKSLIEK